MPRPTSRWRCGSFRCSGRSRSVIERFRPDEAAVEETFVNRNPASTLKLGVARGVVLLAPAERGLPVAEYSANLIKKAVVGAGHAEKVAGADDGAADAAGLRRSASRTPPTRSRWRSATRTTPQTRRPLERGGMIAKLAGVVDQIGPDAAVIDVGGVGYLAFCSTRTIGRLPPPGSPARLLIETHVREDHIHLYGFVDAAERDWFRLLTTVQGVGARLALAILSAVAPETARPRHSGAGQGGADARRRGRRRGSPPASSTSCATRSAASRPRHTGVRGGAARIGCGKWRRRSRRCGLGAGQSRLSAAPKRLARSPRRPGGSAVRPTPVR